MGDTYAYSTKSTRNVMSVEIPVNAVYSIPVGPSGSVFLGAGPYAGFAISGKDKWDNKLTINGEAVTDDETGKGDEKLKFGSGDDKDMKAFEAGINFLAGFKLANGFLINAGYGLGLTDLNPEKVDGYKVSNRVLSFGIGFQF
ncbi:outer membrane beta-barrel protein [Parapusillimonas sp. SGNA-6]|nr:outer membrane beta-barrel protein [Parapusillimonas sp. SGNA-6]